MNDETTPVIVGVGEAADNPDGLIDALDPLSIAATALRNAESDAGANLLERLNSIDLMAITSWRYDRPDKQLAELIGARPTRTAYAPIGGQMPLRAMDDVARRIRKGEQVIAAICGAEAQRSWDHAHRSNFKLPWIPKPEHAPRQPRGRDFCRPVASALDVAMPVSVYPFYETGMTASLGQSPCEAQFESGRIWANMSKVAATNPMGWTKEPRSVSAVIEPTPANRIVCWPYTKHMVANPSVNLGGAVLVTSVAEARRAGVRADRMIPIGAGAWADEATDYLARDQFAQSHAQTAVLEAAMAMNRNDKFDLVELYSCFPCVPKMARRTLGLSAESTLSIAGGLTFFGAPLSNYMTHAVVAAARALRRETGLALLYGQGGFVSKHHALILGGPLLDRAPETETGSVQDGADARMSSIPEFAEQARGSATLESYSIPFLRDGRPSHAAVILRLPGGARTLARVRRADEATMMALMNPDISPVGSGGNLTVEDDGISDWKLV